MRILIYGINFAPELIGVGKYTGEMAAYFTRQGHDVRVITAPPYYPDWRVAEGFSAWRYSRSEADSLAVWRCPLYVPSRPGRLSRLIHLCSFAVSSLPVALLQVFWRPQLILCIQPTLFTAPGALLLSKLSKAKSVLHIQDFEIDAMLGFGISRPGTSARMALRLERCLLKQFDRVASISRSMLDNAREKGVRAENLLLFPNWVDTRVLAPGANRERYRDYFGIPQEALVVLHAGNIGKKQGLEILLPVAKHFSSQQDIFFVIVGEGVQKRELQAQAQSMALDNVLFGELQPPHELANLLAMADLHLVLQRRGGGNAVFPSRLNGLLAVGGNILVTAAEGTELCRLAQKYPGIYHCVEPEDKAAMIAAIESLLFADKQSPNPVAREYALENLSMELILDKFSGQMCHLVDS